MNIYNSNGTQILEVEVDDSSVRSRVIMGDHNITLRYSLAEHVELPVGSYCIFESITYTLKRPENLKMKHGRNFEYTVLMEAPQADTKIWKFRNTVDGRLKFPLTAKPHEHLQMLVDNMNRRGNGWTVGDCVEDVEHLISYDHDFCWDALVKMASEFNTEFEIENKRISLKKVEYNKANPLALSYGKGNGFRSGVARTSSDTPPVEYLFVQGGSDNIDRSKYGSDRAAGGSPVLLLPKSKTISFDGEYFEDEEGYDSTKARSYATDNHGLCIYRTDKAHTTYAEDSLDCSDICPKRVGKVSSLVTVDASKNLYDIVDSSIPNDLNYSSCQIAGEKLTVVFQSGMLAGHGEFEVNYFHNAVNGKAAKRFEIVPKDEDGVIMPNETFKPIGGADGDTYAVFRCMLPAAYICNNSTKSGAEWDMFRTAVKYMYANEDEAFSFKGELDSIWASQDWVNIGGKIKLGGYVLFSDSHFQRNGVKVRITGIKDYINKPHKPEIELSNKTVTAGFVSEVKKIESQEVVNEEYHRDAISFTKRRFRDAQETMDMLNELVEAGFGNFTSNINPITIQTMQMLVGDESLQFRFVEQQQGGTYQTVGHEWSWNSSTKVFSTAAGTIQHMTIGIDNLSSSHAQSEYKYWAVAQFTSGTISDGTKKYYVYIFANKTSQAADIHLSETPIAFEGITGYYVLLAGILNSEYEGERSFVPLYGFTEILPGRMTTDKIVSGDGNSFFDMLNNSLKLGTALDYNSQGDYKLRIKGTIVQSLSGDAESSIGCYRGVYSSSVTYYNGDEVTFTNPAGNTSTYRYIYSTPSSGHSPANSLYWQVIAQGVQGVQAISSFKSIVFKRSTTQPARPSSNSGTYANPVPVGWNDGVPSGENILWVSSRTFNSDGTADAQWAEPRQLTSTAELDIVFSSVENPNPPSGNPNTNIQWGNTADDTTIWMATSKKSNGSWGSWQVMRIKGEDGTDGTSIAVKGQCYNHFETYNDWQSEVTTDEPLVLIDSDDDYNTGDPVNTVYWKYGRPRAGMAPGWRQYIATAGEAFVMESDGHMWLADTDGWHDIGQFRGQTGATGAAGQNAYLHIKFANSMREDDWTEGGGEAPGPYIGVCTDNSPTDPTDWDDYKWSKWHGEDGYGYQYIYKRTTGNTAPNLPSSSAQNYQDDSYVPVSDGWTDNPTDVTEAYPYEWMCYRKKLNGTWGNYIGRDGKAVLWAKYGKDGSNATIVGTAYGHYADITSFNAAKDGLEAGIYLIDVVDGTYNKVASLSSLGIVSLSTASDGDGYILDSTGHLFTTSASGWQDVGQIRGNDGSDGTDGVNGNYTEFRYAVNGSTSVAPSLTKTALNPSGWRTDMPEVGNLQYLWMTSAVKSGDGSTLVSQWTTPVRVTPYNGVDGQNGQDASPKYTWIMYADDAQGSGISNSPIGDGGTLKEYIGFAYNKDTAVESTDPTLYTWSRYKGVDGQNGIAGQNGADGQTLYTWIKYADSLSDGYPSTMYDDPTVNTKYIGIATNKTSQTESDNPRLYKWSKFKGDDGVDGADGRDGVDGRDGNPVASLFRGNYSASATYYGCLVRVDIVKFGNTYYVTRVDAPNGDVGFTGQPPTNTAFWNPFGGSFESVATQLLLAELANIAGFIFKNNKLISQRGTKYGAESTDYSSADFVPNLLLDGVNGNGVFRGIVHASLMYSNVKVVTTSPYQINPAQEPFNWFFVNQNTSRTWLYLPHASEYDGLEINILHRQTNWMLERNDTKIRVDSGDTLYAKYYWDELYSDYHSFVGPDSLVLTPNTHYVVKAINGAWYITTGSVSGD